MKKRHLYYTLTSASLFFLNLCHAQAADAGKLPGLNAPIAESSVSGISSGAFMAVQFNVAWSSVMKGVGIVAGGPYYCATASAFGNLITGGVGPIFSATGPCMSGSPGDLAAQYQEAESKAASGDIDPLSNLAKQKVYLFHGYNDAVVSRPVTDATAKFYNHYLGDSGQSSLFYQEAVGAGHSFVVALNNQPKLDACPDNKLPYIDQCGYDQAGVLLQHIYGKLNPPATGALTGKLKKFDQDAYTGDDIPDALSMADQGYVYIPQSCAQGAACRVHIALHGCKQNAETIGLLFVSYTGYNRWADTNNIIVLYPQTKSSPFLPFNPDACWDWWGYVTLTDDYVTKSGKQIATIKRMLDALTAGATGAAAPAAATPFGLSLNDKSDVSADLTWTAVSGAANYSISRSEDGQNFSPVGRSAGLSFADSGLKPSTAYHWRVTSLGPDGSTLSTADAEGSTLPSPPACDNPGSCPLAQR
jgi:poly(3-hydroxybutyrate) depolymerase